MSEHDHAVQLTSVQREMIDKFVAEENEAYPWKTDADRNNASPKEVAAFTAAAVQRIIMYVTMVEQT